jgi:hypothetical protein
MSDGAVERRSVRSFGAVVSGAYPPSGTDRLSTSPNGVRSVRPSGRIKVL